MSGSVVEIPTKEGKATLEMQSYGILVTFPDSKGGVVRKIVDPVDLSQALTAKSNITTGLIPGGTRYYTQIGGKIGLLLFTPEHTRKIHHSEFRDSKGNVEPIEVRVPNTIMMIALKENFSYLNSGIYVVESPLINENTRLRVFPYGNVYPDSDSCPICWGGIKLPTFGSVNQAGSIPTFFLDSVFNNDLEGRFEPFTYTDDKGKEIKVGRSYQFMQYVKYLMSKGDNVFPYDKLKLSTRVPTIKDAMYRVDNMIKL